MVHEFSINIPKTEIVAAGFPDLTHDGVLAAEMAMEKLHMMEPDMIVVAVPNVSEQDEYWAIDLDAVDRDENCD